MAFLKGAWRLLVGIKDAMVLFLLLIFFGLLYTALTYTPRESAPSSGALLLKLNGVIVEQPQDANPFLRLSGGGSVMREYRLRDVVHAIETAARDDNIKAIVLDLDGFLGGGQVSLSRIGTALDQARAAGRPVLAYATAYSDDAYQLAAHASEIWTPSIGGVMLTGPGGSRLYYKGLIDKLGVTAHIFRVGTYKSFVEPFTRTDQSPEAREAERALTGALWSNWQAEVSRARPKAKLADYATQPLAAVQTAEGDLSKAALDAGLVDRLGDSNAFGKRVAEIAGVDRSKGPGAYAAIPLATYVQKKSAAEGSVGILTIAGNIVDGTAGPGSAAGDTISQLMRKALAEGKIKALVLRINSPGGSVIASEQIRSVILEAKAKGLPVVASMGDVAASGGYWAATPASLIFAEPATVTGSIGVFGIMPSFENSLAKIGITTDGIRTTPLSGQPDLAGGLTPEFSAIAQAGVADVYGRFIKLVSESRRMTPEAVDSVAQGRVWDGGKAREIGLVDRIGGLEAAVAEAARLAKLQGAEARPYYIERKADRLTRLFDDMTREREDDAFENAGIPRDWLTRQAWLRRHWAMQAVADLQGLLSGSALQANCLECRAAMPVRQVDAPVPDALGLWSMLARLF